MELKEKLKKNILTIGSWITIAHPSVVEILASAGFDWLVIDMEHTSIDLYQAQILISTIQANNMKALVRVSKNEEVIIKRVLDCGADGIIVPLVNSEEDAKKAVELAKYPPVGKRGVGLFRAQKYGVGFEEYKKWVSENLVIIAQIEHIYGVKNIEKIVNVEGVDGVIIGPYDLSGSMGIPGEYDKKEVQEAIEKVLKVCKKYNIPSGFHVIETNPNKFIQRVKEGCTFLAYSLDFFFLGDKAREGMEIIKKELSK